MSSLTTPTRIGRGLMIPGINTKPAIDNASSVLSYGGLHTPPQSAHESRRPSLQYSSLPEAPFSATSTSFGYSQPSTPIHSINPSNDGFTHNWPQPAAALAHSINNISNTSPITHVAERSFQAAFEAQAGYNAAAFDTAPSYSHLTHARSTDRFGLLEGSTLPTHDSWHPSQEIANGFEGQHACLGSTLFPDTQGLSDMASGSISAFGDEDSSMHALCPQLSSSSVGSLHGYNMTTSMYQHPQVVVPSQLSPQDDFSHQQFAYYTSAQNSRDVLSSSFGSSSAAFNDYDIVGPPSPTDAYFAHSEDEDYLMVKTEEIDSPITGPSSHRLAAPNGISLRPKRRSPRRLRKASKNIHCHIHDVRGCLVQCEGKQCYLQPLKVEVGRHNKPHECTYPNCGARFDRSEHLKRHLGKHQDKSERKYPCPLPGCGKKIGRPDNAGDHFKTHLRPKSKGKRNDNFEWPVLRDAILACYDDNETARKLIDGLQRWMASGMPDTSGSRRMA